MINIKRVYGKLLFATLHNSEEMEKYVGCPALFSDRVGDLDGDSPLDVKFSGFKGMNNPGSKFLDFSGTSWDYMRLAYDIPFCYVGGHALVELNRIRDGEIVKCLIALSHLICADPAYDNHTEICLISGAAILVDEPYPVVRQLLLTDWSDYHEETKESKK